jgi:hypothetical protein
MLPKLAFVPMREALDAMHHAIRRDFDICLIKICSRMFAESRTALRASTPALSDAGGQSVGIRRRSDARRLSCMDLRFSNGVVEKAAGTADVPLGR